ncbi:2Fe-2S iron-sulfur cluster-binding protein [Nitrincola alkalilacustris]|uniref:2Fe-2S iron-sulfur cluster-binding protein n=1 Tax=Nitrincola alkalilacustris TaxID=1571224 RepID=UPI00124C78AB|nr:2Fe-2S iron-sulfur cluster-binding protein [Nitrincola alkalilacustris]
MRISLTLQQQAHELETEVDQPLLALFKMAGLPVREACRNGNCGVCRCRLVSGEVDYRSRKVYGLREEEISEGFILTCIAHAVTDLELDTFLPQLSRIR